MADATSHGSGIYVIRNIVSGRVYVGSAVNFFNRWKSHRHTLSNGTHHSRTLCRSWSKHGKEAFVFEIIEIVDKKEELLAREQFWIDALNSANPRTGFNIAPQAGSRLGVKSSLAARKRQSIRMTGRKHSPATIALMIEKRRARSISAEQLQKLRNILRSKEHIDKVKVALTGKKKSASHCKSLSLSAARRERARRIGDITDQLSLEI